ncbi:MAG: GDP-mannose 4,6-dehydratase [Patescibacteria group bacterium]|nr:GDP-mannose 4,6-dehydratase [Patescibacteria group bacterium]
MAVETSRNIAAASARFWYDRNVFVTGATGLLGPWLVKSLVDAGAHVTILVRDIPHRSYLYTCGCLPLVNQVFGELGNGDLLERVLNEYEVDTVFHLGAQAIVGIANRNPISTFESNIRGTWNLLEAVRRNPHVERVIVASSDKAYGNQDVLPYTEATSLSGRYPYDVSKSCVDLISQSYFHTYRTPVAIVRCGNFFGGGDLNFNRVVPGTVKFLWHDQSPIIRSNGMLVRDYFYIEDVAAAYRMLAENLREKQLAGQAFNFASGNPVTVLEMVQRITALMGKALPPTILNTATNEIPAQYLSSQKAREVLGWQPQYTLDDGLRRTISWYDEFFRQHQPAAA